MAFPSPRAALGHDLLRILTGATAGIVAALICLIFYTGDLRSPTWWLTAVPLSLWIAGPAFVPWLIALRLREAVVSGLMLVFLVVSSTISAYIYGHAFFYSIYPSSALALIFFPGYQWIGVAVVTAIALLASALIETRGD